MNYGSLLWPADATAARIIILIILTMGAISLTLAWRHFRRLTGEMQQIRRVESKLDQWEAEATINAPETDPDQTSADPGSPEPTGTESPGLRLNLSELDSRLTELESCATIGSHIRERVQAIRRLRTRQVKVNVETLQQLTEAREKTAWGIETPRQVASWSMMLGVIGTFIGLSAMVREIQLYIPEGALTLDRMSETLQEMNAVLVGMETAFSTSVAGMLMAIISALAAFVVARTQRTMFHRLEVLTVAKLIPASVTAMEDDSILERISVQMEQSFAHLDAITQAHRDAVRDFATSQQSLQAIVDDVQRILHAEARKDVASVIAKVSENNQRVADLINTLPGIAKAISATDRSLQSGLQRMDKTLRSTPVISPPRGAAVYALNPRYVWIAVLVAAIWALAASFGLFG